MKNLQNLKGAKALNKKEQQTINGGRLGQIGSGDGCCNPANDCCTTADLVGNPNCGATLSPGCQYHYANPNTPQHPFWTCCI